MANAGDAVTTPAAVSGLAGVLAVGDADNVAAAIARAVKPEVVVVGEIRVIGDLSALGDMTTLRILTSQVDDLAERADDYVKSVPSAAPPAPPMHGVKAAFSAVPGLDEALAAVGRATAVIGQLVTGAYAYSGQAIPNSGAGGLDILIAKALAKELGSSTTPTVRVDRLAAMPADSQILKKIQGLSAQAAGDLARALIRSATAAAVAAEVVADDKDRLSRLEAALAAAREKALPVTALPEKALPEKAEPHPDGQGDDADEQPDGPDDQPFSVPDQREGAEDQAGTVPDQRDFADDQLDSVPDQRHGTDDQVDSVPDRPDEAVDQAGSADDRPGRASDGPGSADDLAEERARVSRRLPVERASAAAAQNLLTEGQALVEAISGFLTTILSGPAGGGPAPVARAAHGEVLAGSDTAILYAQVIASGDDRVMGQSALHHKWSNLTGITAEYALMKPDGNVAALGLESAFSVANGSIRKGLEDVRRKPVALGTETK